MVAKITKKIDEWSVRETTGENAVLTHVNLEEKTEGNRGIGAKENRGLGGPREPTGEENRGIFPSGSERPELDLEEFFGRGYPGTPYKRRKAEKIKKLGGMPKQPREQIRATLLPGYCVCDSAKTRMRIQHQLHSSWMVLGVDYFSFAHHGTVLPSPVPRSASGALQRRRQRNPMNRTLRRLPSYTIPDESTPQRSVRLGVPQKRDQRRVVVLFLVVKGAAALKGEINETAVPYVR